MAKNYDCNGDPCGEYGAAVREAQTLRDEVARLRLTEEEKKGIDGIIRDFQVIAEFNEERCHPHYAQKARCRVAMLSGLLKRLG